MVLNKLTPEEALRSLCILYSGKGTPQYSPEKGLRGSLISFNSLGESFQVKTLKCLQREPRGELAGLSSDSIVNSRASFEGEQIEKTVSGIYT
jgi:hypothetical protein